jgi:flavin reductase (DIM6/NTAB) family NADH-FMN oxidoreductase RutF
METSLSQPNSTRQAPLEISPRELRNALGGFVTGVTAVTTELDGKRYGFTANSFSSVSLDPPLVLVCIGKTSSNFETFQRAGHFCVNILAESQRNISQQFAAKGVDRFAGIELETGVLGSPVIKDSVSWFECSLHQRIDAGDHEILIGLVADFGYTTGSPLGYCRGNYVMFELEQQIMNARGQRGRFGAILETSEGVILVEGEKPGTLALPTASSLGTREKGDGLFGALAALGCDFDIEFLFSVWEGTDTGNLNVYYRGSAAGRPTSSAAQVFALDAIPHDRLHKHDSRLLTRYAEERANFRFSVYTGTETTGSWFKAHRQDANA